jgi:uncharacterized protein YukE
MGGVGWEILGFDDDPVQGDPERLRSLASRLGEEADRSRAHAERLRGLAARGGEMRMEGEYAQRYRDALNALPQQAAVLEPAHQDAMSALNEHAGMVEQAKAQSRAALERGVEAKQRYDVAVSRLESLQAEAAMASSPDQVYEIQVYANQLQNAAREAEQDLMAARQMAAQAGEIAEDSAVKCANILASAAPKPPPGHAGSGTGEAPTGGGTRATVEARAGHATAAGPSVPGTTNGPATNLGIDGANHRYHGALMKSPDKYDRDADMLSRRLGGQSQVFFENDPTRREFDTVSDEYVGQAKPGGFRFGKTDRSQAKESFEAARNTGRSVYYHFNGEPNPSAVRQLKEYSRRYGVPVVIDTDAFE